MKKSYHSSDVPIRLATMARRTDDGGGWVVLGELSADIRPPRGWRPDDAVPHEGTHCSTMGQEARSTRIRSVGYVEQRSADGGPWGGARVTTSQDVGQLP